MAEWLETAKCNKKLLHWAMQLEPHNYTVIHVPETENEAADALSRILLRGGTGVGEEVLEETIPPNGKSYIKHNNRSEPSLEISRRENALKNQGMTSKRPVNKTNHRKVTIAKSNTNTKEKPQNYRILYNQGTKKETSAVIS